MNNSNLNNQKNNFQNVNHQPNQANNNVQSTQTKKTNNNKITIIIIALVIIITLIILKTNLLINNNNNNNENITNNNNINNSQNIIYNDFKYNEILNNFGVFDNKYVFNNTYDNITIDAYNPNSQENAIELTVDYNNKNYKFLISGYKSYDNYKYNLSIDENENTKYLIDTENEIFSINEKDNSIIIANYGYKLGDMIIELEFYNNYHDKRKINTTPDELREVINICKNTINLNNNNNPNPEEQLKDFYIFNNYKLTDINNIKKITEDSLSLSFNNNDIVYYIDIYFDINDHGYEFSNLLDEPKETKIIDGFTINWTNYDIKSMISMDKNNQKLYFLISMNPSSNNAPNLEESYNIFKLAFSN